MTGWVRSGWMLICLMIFGAGQGLAGAARPVPASKTPGRVALTDRYRTTLDRLSAINLKAARLAVEDLATAWPGRYDAARHRRALEEFARRAAALRAGLEQHRPESLAEAEGLCAGVRAALLANPLLDADRLLLLRRTLGKRARSAMGAALGVGTLNAHTNDSIPRTGWNNELTILDDLRGAGTLKTLYHGANGAPITDPELHYDGKRIMFSSIGQKENNWRLFEIQANGTGLRQLSPDDGADVGHFDSCYLPDGRIVFDSTAAMQGLPCENGGRDMASLYLLDPATQKIRQLTFEQDSDWCPTVLNNGRVLYQHWEYADLPHSNSRFLMHMNPDGSNQTEYYGSGSYFPPSLFYARPVPGHPTLVAAIATGHHGTPRSGRLLLIDPARGRHEAEGIVQEIPGRGKKVAPIVADRIVDGVWPQFLQPWPLSEKYYLVAMKRTPQSLWGIYLVDVFDNMTLIKEAEGAALLDPMLLAPRPTPPVIPDRIDLAKKTATVHIQDIYVGPGLKGIPRGTVKRLRVGSYYFSPRKTGGLLGTVGMDGPWDIKRILGTVPVAADGSAYFTVPANTPIFVQPLDGQGRALQLMRSWFVGMPGEFISCVGCHEPQNSLPPSRNYSVAGRTPQAITPWHGPERNFDFRREVQPVLDQRCIGCHDGAKATPDLRGDKLITDWSSQIAGHAGPGYGGRFSAAYAELHRFVRRPGIESDLHPLTPMEFFAESAELVQLLRKGHHGVALSQDQWETLFAWIDLNAPYHGTRSAMYDPNYIARINARARELSEQYAGVAVDYEKLPPAPPRLEPVIPQETPEPPMAPAAAAGWPFDATEAVRRAAGHAPLKLDLGGSVTLELVYIPAGEFVMGGAAGHPDERPLAAVRIERGFWMGRTEVTNAQFARFDAAHDSRNEPRHGYQFGRLGYPENGPAQPVVRVSWREAAGFCEWLGKQTGRRVALPTEAQWEWACRAGAATPFWFGGLDSDYTAFANLGDRKLKEFAACTARGNYTLAEVVPNPSRYDDWIPRDDRFDDGGFVSENVARYRPNAWGLYDMHGNAWEWTRSAWRPYPYREDDGRNAPVTGAWRVVRGGSWYDRPQRCTASYRLAYPDFEKVFNAGFRIIIEGDR